MSLSRRQWLWMAGSAAWLAHSRPRFASAYGRTGDASPGALLLHSGEATALAEAREIQAARSAPGTAERTLTLLTYDGFLQADALLAVSGGRMVFALFEDAESLVMESLLAKHGARKPDRRRHGRRLILLCSQV